MAIFNVILYTLISNNIILDTLRVSSNIKNILMVTALGVCVCEIRLLRDITLQIGVRQGNKTWWSHARRAWGIEIVDTVFRETRACYLSTPFILSLVHLMCVTSTSYIHARARNKCTRLVRAPRNLNRLHCDSCWPPACSGELYIVVRSLILLYVTRFYATSCLRDICES